MGTITLGDFKLIRFKWNILSLTFLVVVLKKISLTLCIGSNTIIIGYWLDMEIYVRVLVRRNIARRQEHNINYAPERVHIFPYPTNNLFITYALLSQKTFWHYCITFINKISKITTVLNKQKLKFKTKVKQLLPLPFLRLSRNMNVYSKEFHS